MSRVVADGAGTRATEAAELAMIDPRWRRPDQELRESFRAARPFPLVVLDGFLTKPVARALVDEFPLPEEMPRSRDYMFGNKRELSSIDRRGDTARRFWEMTQTEPFAGWLTSLTGYEGLFVDPDFFGGGFHQGGDGSFLDLHADFNLHPEHPTWLRTLNLLVYLNPGWRDEWGGQLLVRDGPDGPERAIAPAFNRCVVMLTADHTFHGYRRMSLPGGVVRRSLAAYAYRDLGDAHGVRRRTTSWAPEGAGPLKRLLARHYNRAVLAKNRLFGSRTSGNR